MGKLVGQNMKLYAESQEEFDGLEFAVSEDPATSNIVVNPDDGEYGSVTFDIDRT